MEENEKVRKGKRMRNMKEAAAIVLSIAMVFGNAGVAKAATGAKVQQKESKVTKQVKVQSEDGDTEEDSTISFDEESLNTRIGCFKEYKFQGVDAEKIQDVDFEYENKQNVLEVKKVQWYIGSGSEKNKLFMFQLLRKQEQKKLKLQ